MKRPRTTDLVLSALIAVMICFALAPAVARMQRSSAEAKCQSNIRRWAQAMDAYLADNHLCYPTNQDLSGTIAKEVALSNPTATGADGKPIRFQNGVGWVEALYPYLWAASDKTGQDWRSFWRCPNSSEVQTSANASMTYSLNYNLVRQPKAIIRDPSKLMMFREMDKLVGSVLRPANQSWNSSSLPVSPFLVTGQDMAYLYVNQSPTDGNRHGSGSYICFADGHIKYFTLDYFPTVGTGSSAISVCYYDVDDTTRWWNIVTAGDPKRMTIAVTP